MVDDLGFDVAVYLVTETVELKAFLRVGEMDYPLVFLRAGPKESLLAALSVVEKVALTVANLVYVMAAY